MDQGQKRDKGRRSIKLRDAERLRWRDLTQMKKLVIIVIAFAIFIAVLVTIVVPSQGGLQSSSQLKGRELNNAQPQYVEDLPIQDVDLGGSGRSIFIAFVMLTHVLFANLHLGGSWVAAGTESVFLKTGMVRYDRLARSITLFNLILFSAGATFAATGVFFFIGLYPKFASYSFHIWWWPLLAEALLFASQITLIALYWYSWGKIDRKWHQVLGYSYAVAVFFQTLMINTIASGMLTPGGTSVNFIGGSGIALMLPTDYTSWWFNATTLKLQMHRIGASFSFFGFLLATLAVLHYLDRPQTESKRYWDWVSAYGIGWGLIGFIFQPVLGFIYMIAIRDAQPSAFDFMMHGPRAWEMLLMVGLISVMGMLTVTYFIDRRERIIGNTTSMYRFMQVCLIAVAIAGFILVQPAWFGATSRGDPAALINPLGLMVYKYIALFVLVAVGALMFLVDYIALSDYREVEWGNLPRASRAAAFLLGIFGMWTIIVMGFFRESGRSPWTIYGITPIPGGESYFVPIPMWQIFVLWGIILVLVFVIFWFTSRVTAYHPEKVEA